MNSGSALPRAINGLADIADQYDLYLFDQWGVLHDGRKLYPKVVAALTRLRQMPGKTLLVLSNSSKSAATTQVLLNSLGLDPDIFDAIITSGEHFLQCLRQRPNPFYAKLGNQYYGIHWPEGFQLPDDLAQYQHCDNLDEADFILLTGLSDSLSCYQPVLTQALQANIPMICANPDLYSPEGGKIKACPGQLAEAYRAMGGTVVSHGKPAKELYDIILQQFPHDPKRTLAVGDSLCHDILGANRAGIDGWFFTQGIHQPAWQQLHQICSASKATRRLADQHQVHVDYFSHGLD